MKERKSFVEKNGEMGISGFPTCVHGTVGHITSPVWDDDQRGREQTLHGL